MYVQFINDADNLRNDGTICIALFEIKYRIELNRTEKKSRKGYWQFINDADHLKNGTICIALCEMK